MFIILIIQFNSNSTVDGDMIMPGSHGNVRLTTFKKMVMPNGQRFTIRELSRTVATGVVTKAHDSVDLPMSKLSKVVVNL